MIVHFIKYSLAVPLCLQKIAALYHYIHVYPPPPLLTPEYAAETERDMSTLWRYLRIDFMAQFNIITCHRTS